MTDGGNGELDVVRGIATLRATVGKSVGLHDGAELQGEEAAGPQRLPVAATEDGTNRGGAFCAWSTRSGRGCLAHGSTIDRCLPSRPRSAADLLCTDVAPSQKLASRCF